MTSSPRPSGQTPAGACPASAVRDSEPTEANIRELVYAFYDRVRADALLGPVFDAVLHGRWDEHLPKMCLFWGSLVLGDKRYRGNVQQAHQPIEGLEPRHFSRWLHLFLDTVCDRYQPTAAVRFMEPALRIAQSLQLSRYGWNYKVPPEQQVLLDRIAPKRAAEALSDAASPARRRPAEPFPAKIIGRGSDEADSSGD